VRGQRAAGKQIVQLPQGVAQIAPVLDEEIRQQTVNFIHRTLKQLADDLPE
jgi:hypothetical protein